MFYAKDKIIFSPFQVDLNYSPIRKHLDQETFILGAFNPGLTRLKNGNLLIMIRIAEALKHPNRDGFLNILRWTAENGYGILKIPEAAIDNSDPRKYRLKEYDQYNVYALTSMSWLLPVELDPDGMNLVKIHYDKIITSEKNYQEFGIEDPRITKIKDTYYMTTCSVSSERHSTTLYSSSDGLAYSLEGIIMDHQNKDMVIFPEKIRGKYYALTRPLGEHYFLTDPSTDFVAGTSINLSESPDLLHWKPCEEPFIRMTKNSKVSMKLGGGSPPILTEKGWLILFHGVEDNKNVGIYRTFWALLDKDTPNKIIRKELENPLLVSNYEISKNICKAKYLDDIVFTTGIAEYKDCFVVLSGELDLCCRTTLIPKTQFSL